MVFERAKKKRKARIIRKNFYTGKYNLCQIIKSANDSTVFSKRLRNVMKTKCPSKKLTNFCQCWIQEISHGTTRGLFDKNTKETKTKHAVSKPHSRNWKQISTIQKFQ
jgi:hypothetical protein